MMIGSSDETVRVDLHLHSRASGSATNVWVKGLGDDGDVRESYTLPEESYRMAKRAGMDFVTLTDHETIDGSLTLLHHPDFLVGEEVSARFPEDGGYADILLFGLWEFVNGSRPASQNHLAREAAEKVGALDLRQMALRHGLSAPDHTRIAGTGGSDDHGGIYGGRFSVPSLDRCLVDGCRGARSPRW